MSFQGSNYVTAIVNKVLNTVFDYVPDGEDCLTLNIVTPDTFDSKNPLPVFVWFYGGGFQAGSSNIYDGRTIVTRSIQMKTPVVFVSINYRLNIFGFLTGKQAKAAGATNLGLHDQRLALRWLKKYIKNFGGDPDRITLDFEDYADSVGCADTPDVIECLRNAQYDTLKAAMYRTKGLFGYRSVALPFAPVVDGVFFKEQPMYSILAGRVAKVPVVSGDTKNEGNLFSFGSLNVTEDSHFRQWVKDTFNLPASEQEMDRIMELYPTQFIEGDAPGGYWYPPSPQFNRIARFQGDLVFQAPRRRFLTYMSALVPAWSYTYEPYSIVPLMGSFHGADLTDIFGYGPVQDAAINFVVSHDPNGYQPKGSKPAWPRYTPDDPQILVVNEGLWTSLSTRVDNHREEAIQLIGDISLRY
ncbi:hypothetical protein FRB99_007725 [Tulasnella sp. 403]|nr:hypothetical protein FRB99_007725 [Tulasnella sp. 403]